MTSSKHLSDGQAIEVTVDSQELLLLSAMVDGESDTQQLGSDLGAYREQWAVYHVISDVMRDSSSLRPVSSEFVSRMSAAMNREASHGLAPSAAAPHRPGRSVWQQLVGAWPGVAVAAAVASVVWVAEPLLGVTVGSQQSVAIATKGAQPTQILAAQASPVLDYVNAHRQLAGPIAIRDTSFRSGAD